MSCSKCQNPLGIKRTNNTITKHLNEGFILVTKNVILHLNHECHPESTMIDEILLQIPQETEWSSNKNVKIEEKCPVMLESFEDNPYLEIVIPPCNHPISLDVFHNLITNGKPCPICRDKNFVGINKILSKLDLKRNQTQVNYSVNTAMERISSCELGRSASLAPCIEYDETVSNIGHCPNLRPKNYSTHMELRKAYLNGKSITDVNAVYEYSGVKLPIYALTLTQKSTYTGFNDLFVCILEKNVDYNYELINSGTDSIVNFSKKNLSYKSLKLSHSGDPSNAYPQNFGGYLYGNNGEQILDHRLLISSLDNDKITDLKIHNLDIPYTGSERISSNFNHFNGVLKEFTKVANNLELKESSNIVILLSQITYTSQTLRELSTPCQPNHQSIQPSCIVLTTNLTDDKEIKIAPWNSDNSYMNTYLAIELIMKN